jgi:hypothetical protein
MGTLGVKVVEVGSMLEKKFSNIPMEKVSLTHSGLLENVPSTRINVREISVGESRTGLDKNFDFWYVSEDSKF